MKQKTLRILFLLIASVTLVFASCQTTTPEQQTVQQPIVQETVQEQAPVVQPAPEPVVEAAPTQPIAYEAISGAAVIVDKYGNVTTDIPVASVYAAGYELGDVVTVTINGQNRTMPFVDTYSDVNRGDFLIRPSGEVIAMAISYGNFGEVTGTTEGTAVAFEMAEKKGYLDEYEIRHLVKSENRDDYASDEIFANFRNVSYGGIAENRLYRSANPILDDARGPYAAVLTETAQIRTVVNLADNPNELAAISARSPYYESLVSFGQVIALNMGVDFASPDFTAKLKDGLMFMIRHEGPYLIHCNEGKDRAGMVIALLEALMGATIEEIVEDYMVTYENYFGVEKGTAKYDLISSIILDVLKDINAGEPVTNDNLQVAAENYLRDTVGLSNAYIAALKVRLK